MAYGIKEIFLTLQGEGAQTGRVAVFCRFAGCNLWSGREQDRAGAVCRFCDTDFADTDGINGGKFDSAQLLAEGIETLWPAGISGQRYAVLTGGEPLLQVDEALIEALHYRGFRVAVETNGTIPAPAGIDWLCVSPKAGSRVVQRRGDELKLVVPQENLDPEDFAGWEFRHFSLQPMDGPQREESIRWAIAYCLAHPRWRLSLQTHKIIGIR